MMRALSIFLILATAATAFAAKFPSNWKKCPKKDNEECLKEAVESVFKDMKTGKKEFNVIPLDPLHFSRMEMNQGGKSPVNINLTFFDLDLIGVSRVKISSISADWDNNDISMIMDVQNGPAHLLGDYAITGKVLVLPIQGKGKANITLENCSVNMTIKGKEEFKNGKKYFKVEEAKFQPRSTRVHFWFGDLFNGNKQLGDNMNKFLNENWQLIMNELNTTITNAIGLGAKEVSSRFFQTIPVTDLFDE